MTMTSTANALTTIRGVHTMPHLGACAAEDSPKRKRVPTPDLLTTETLESPDSHVCRYEWATDDDEPVNVSVSTDFTVAEPALLTCTSPEAVQKPRAKRPTLPRPEPAGTDSDDDDYDANPCARTRVDETLLLETFRARAQADAERTERGVRVVASALPSTDVADLLVFLFETAPNVLRRHQEMSAVLHDDFNLNVSMSLPPWAPRFPARNTTGVRETTSNAMDHAEVVAATLRITQLVLLSNRRPAEMPANVYRMNVLGAAYELVTRDGDTLVVDHKAHTFAGETFLHFVSNYNRDRVREYRRTAAWWHLHVMEALGYGALAGTAPTVPAIARQIMAACASQVPPDADEAARIDDIVALVKLMHCVVLSMRRPAASLPTEADRVPVWRRALLEHSAYDLAFAACMIAQRFVNTDTIVATGEIVPRSRLERKSAPRRSDTSHCEHLLLCALRHEATCAWMGHENDVSARVRGLFSDTHSERLRARRGAWADTYFRFVDAMRHIDIDVPGQCA